jgi:hypothetical protein
MNVPPIRQLGAGRLFDPGVRFAHIFKTDVAMAALYIGRHIAQMGGTHIFDAVGFGPAVPAFNDRVVGKSQDTIVQVLRFQSTHMLAMVFTVARHVFSFDVLSIKWAAQIFLRLFALAPQ